MKWSRIKLICKREIRDQLRDRRTLFMVFILPVLLYPALALGMMWLNVEGRGRLASMQYRVGVDGLGALSGLEPLIRDGLFLAELYPENVQNKEQLVAVTDDLSVEAIKQRRLQVLLRLPNTFQQDIADDARSVEVTLLYSSADDRSRTAYRTLTRILDKWNDRLLGRRLHALGKDMAFVSPVQLSEEDVASPAASAASRWGNIFSFLLVVMALTGAFYPSVDLCAGEKERGTIETLLISPAKRSEIVLGKYITVFIASVATALLNLGGMGFTAWHMATMASGLGEKVTQVVAFNLGPLAVLWMLLVLLPLAALFSASCLAMAAFARSTKEGQYYLTPLFIITFPLVLLTFMPGVELNGVYACIPVSGSALLLKVLLLGDYVTARVYVVPVLLATSLYAYIALRWAISLFNREEVLFREAEKFQIQVWARHLVRDKQSTPSSGEAMFAFVLIVVLIYFVGYLTHGDFARSMVVTQLALVGAPILLMTGFLTSSYRQTLRLRLPNWRFVVVGLALAVVLHPLLIEGNYWISREMAGIKVLQKAMTRYVAGLSYLTMLVLLAFLPAVFEELAFRGFILSGLRRRHPPAGAVLMSAILFGAFHLNPYQFPGAVALGVVLGLLAMASGSILPGMVFHFVSNLLVLSADRVSSWFGRHMPWLVRSAEHEPTLPLYDWPMLVLSAILVGVGLWWLVKRVGESDTSEGQ